MKTSIRFSLPLALTIGLVACVHAVPITGSIGFTGTYTQNGGTIGDLTTATSMTINPAVGVQPFSEFGDFVGAGAPLSFASPIGVNGNAPAIVQLWSVTVGGFTYALQVTSQTQTFTSPIQLNLAGTGIISSTDPSKDDTAGVWQLGFGKSGEAFTWQATSSANVPEGGLTVMLLGAALMAMGLVRRMMA